MILLWWVKRVGGHSGSRVQPSYNKLVFLDTLCVLYIVYFKHIWQDPKPNMSQTWHSTNIVLFSLKLKYMNMALMPTLRDQITTQSMNFDAL